MTALLRHPMTKVWLMLTTATLVLFSLFENERAVRVMTGMTIVIAGFKVRLVFYILWSWIRARGRGAQLPKCGWRQ